MKVLAIAVVALGLVSCQQVPSTEVVSTKVPVTQVLEMNNIKVTLQNASAVFTVNTGSCAGKKECLSATSTDYEVAVVPLDVRPDKPRWRYYGDIVDFLRIKTYDYKSGLFDGVVVDGDPSQILNGDATFAFGDTSTPNLTMTIETGDHHYAVWGYLHRGWFMVISRKHGELKPDQFNKERPTVTGVVSIGYPEKGDTKR